MKRGKFFNKVDGDFAYYKVQIETSRVPFALFAAASLRCTVVCVQSLNSR